MLESSAHHEWAKKIAGPTVTGGRRYSTRDALIAGIVQELQEILQQIDRYSRWSLRRFGVTGPQVWALREIRRLGRVTTGGLADRMYLHISTVSSLIDRLEQRHLVRRFRIPSDRRNVWLQLTTRGERTVVSTPPSPRSRLPEGLRRLSERNLLELRRSLVRLGSILRIGAARVSDRARVHRRN